MKKSKRILAKGLVFLPVILFLACGGGGGGNCSDNDKDGYGQNCALGTDCDDTNPLIHPNAPESACNDIDDNCDKTEDEEEVVIFADDDLKSVIKTALSLSGDTILNTDLCGLEYLNANTKNISDLTGIEYCTALAVLYLNSNQISDISPLAYLTNLSELYLQSNTIDDISVLEGLTELYRLELQNNQITDITPLLNNLGIGTGDYVYLNGNLLDADDCDEIEGLVFKGVNISHSLICP